MTSGTAASDSEPVTAIDVRAVNDASAPDDDLTSLPGESRNKRGVRFWLVFAALCLTIFCSALELTSVSTALPTIVHDLKGSQFVWVGSAYSLASAAFMPSFGGLATIFGRRSVMIGVLIFFIAGSAVCGASVNLNMLIAGRTIQGIGGGGILSLVEIIVADLVPLKERGAFAGAIGGVWAVASAIGPPVGGVLASRGAWRWLFYLNIPLGALALSCVLFFLTFRVPQTTLREKFSQMDWIGNFLVIASTTSCTIALTWAGVQYPWSSPRSLVPLVLGLVGLGAFFFYEFRYPKYPIVPYDLLSSRTGASGHATTFIHGFLVMVLVYYIPVFFQASRNASPIRSGIDTFGIAFSIAPFAIIAGVTTQIFNRYRPQNYIAWVLIVAGFGALSALKVNSSLAEAVGFQILAGSGLGLLFTGTTYPVLASVPVTKNAQALALFTFMRAFAQTWGITIGATILQNELKKKIPESLLSLLPGGISLSYSVIPLIPTLAQPLQREVQTAFAESLSVVWKVMIAISGLGLLAALPMKELDMHVVTDENWGFEQKERKSDAEKGGEKTADVEKHGEKSAP